MNSIRLFTGSAADTAIIQGTATNCATADSSFSASISGSFSSRSKIASEGTPSSSVCPSGAERATAAVPIIDWPPGLFSTTTGCLNAPEKCCAIWRPMVSAVPPGFCGTMMRTVLFG